MQIAMSALPPKADIELSADRAARGPAAAPRAIDLRPPTAAMVGAKSPTKGEALDNGGKQPHSDGLTTAPTSVVWRSLPPAIVR